MRSRVVGRDNLLITVSVEVWQTSTQRDIIVYCNATRGRATTGDWRGFTRPPELRASNDDVVPFVTRDGAVVEAAVGRTVCP
ncbi:hypothetical protein QTP88_019384 [Uroleucon formosanum]